MTGGADLGTIVAHLRLDVQEFTQGIDSAREQLQDTANNMEGLTKAATKMQKIGAGLTAAVTVPVAGIGKAALETHQAFTSSMSNVQALSGATGKDLEDLSNLAREMGATTQYSASEAADALG